MQFFYQLLYHPVLNPILTSVLKAIPGLPRKFRIPPSGTISLTLKNGKTMKLKTNQTCHVTYEVFWKGTSSYEFSDIFEKLFEKAQVYFDVGSNIGYYAIMAGRTNPDLDVYAFDPSPGPFAFLKDNIQENRLLKVKPFQLALSNENGTFSFQVAINPKYTYLKYNSLGGSGHLQGTREDNSPYMVSVEAMRLDDFVLRHNIRRLDLMKLDVEEAEHLVLMGAEKTLKTLRPIVVCEVFSTEMLENIMDQWKGSGYEAFIFEDGGLRHVSYSPGYQLNQIENFFFVPSEKLDWITEFIRS